MSVFVTASFFNPDAGLLVNKIVDYNILPTDNGVYFHNFGASSAVYFTLPAADPGLNYHFMVETAQTVKVIAGGSSTIPIGTVTSVVSGFISSDRPRSTIHIFAVTPTEWVAIASTGSWDIT